MIIIHLDSYHGHIENVYLSGEFHPILIVDTDLESNDPVMVFLNQPLIRVNYKPEDILEEICQDAFGDDCKEELEMGLEELKNALGRVEDQ